MPGDKVNNWKSKLEELQTSDDIFNKEASWNKLYLRLQPVKKNKKTLWYWIAAACLLIAFFTTFFLPNKKENILVKNNAPQEKKAAPFIAHDTLKNFAAASGHERKPVISIAKNDKTSKPVTHKIIKVDAIHNITAKNETIPQQTSDTAVMPVNTAIALAAVVPVKKQLKILHINELGNTPPQKHYQPYNEYASSPFHLMNPVYESAPQQVKTGFKIFTIKNISTN